jgi:hypothetical protein
MFRRTVLLSSSGFKCIRYLYDEVTLRRIHLFETRRRSTSTLKMEAAARFFETLLSNHNTTRNNNPENHVS